MRIVRVKDIEKLRSKHLGQYSQAIDDVIDNSVEITRENIFNCFWNNKDFTILSRDDIYKMAESLMRFIEKKRGDDYDRSCGILSKVSGQNQ